MRHGSRSEQITLQTKSLSAPNALNERTESWIEYRKVFAAVTARRGVEHFDATTKQRYTETVTHFDCDYYDVQGLSGAMRILYEDRVYNIKNIRPDHAKKAFCTIEAAVQDASVA